MERFNRVKLFHRFVPHEYKYFCFTAFVLLFVSLPSLADYGWIPRYQTLVGRVGGEFYRTSENFDRTGLREDIQFQNQRVSLNESRLWFDLDYGFSEDWSVYFRANLLQARVKPQAGGDSLLEAAGAGDLKLALKRRFRRALPILTLEARLVVPTYGKLAAADELLPGPGSFDTAFLLHSGYRIKRFFFAFSPGVLFRFGGFSHAFILEGGLGARFLPVYVLAFFDWIASFGDNVLFDSSLDTHDANGTGGSFSRLAGSPNNFSMGLKAGVFVGKNYAIEADFSHALGGKRAPNFFRFSLNVRAVFDFYKRDTRKELREVPFERPHKNPIPKKT